MLSREIICHQWRLLFLGVFVVFLLPACSSLSPNTLSVEKATSDDAVQVDTNNEDEALVREAVATAKIRGADVTGFNRQLTNLSAKSTVLSKDYEYRLGIGDVITVDAFQVEELRQFKSRIEGQGAVALPLIGRVKIAGKTVGEAERILRGRLGEYLHDPKVSIFIDNYQSQEVTVAGEVTKPGIYPLTRPRTLVEMLTMAGGLTADAGYKISVQVREVNTDTGEAERQNLLVDLRDLVKNEQVQKALVLNGGDSVFVPKAGIFFIEGAVEKPNSYPIQGEMDVLKAVTMAGGVLWEASDDAIRIIRQEGDQSKTLRVDIDSLRENRGERVAIRDGDIIVVGESDLKSGFATFWRGMTSVISVGFSGGRI